MPAGTIQHQHSDGADRDVPADFHQVLVHRLDVDLWHDDRRTCAALRTDRSEQIGHSYRRSRGTRGREPRSAQTRVMVPC